MAMYFLMGKLTGKGRELARAHPDHTQRAAASIETGDARILGHYPVLGRFDVIVMVEAEDNASVARVSSALGSAAGFRFETLSALSPEVLTGVPQEPKPVPALAP